MSSYWEKIAQQIKTIGASEYGFKSRLSRQLGVQPQVLDRWINQGVTPAFDSGKAAEDFLRREVFKKYNPNGITIKAGGVSLGVEYEIGYLAEANMVICKSLISSETLPNNETESRALAFIKKLKELNIKLELSKVGYYEVNTTPKQIFATKVNGMTNKMKGLAAEYQQLKEDEEMEVLMLSILI